MFRASFLAFATLGAIASAHEKFKDRIPNGHNVVDSQGEGWDGVGHQRRGGGGALNPFGRTFVKWVSLTKELCQKDSDCDGIPNGVELGDPSCTWSEGETPQFDVAITHPGFTDAERQATIDSCADFDDRTVTPGEIDVTLTFPPYSVPSKRTTYAKYGFTVDKPKLNGADELMGIRFEPIVDNPNVVHHMLLYSCSRKSDIAQYENAPKEGPMSCSELVWAWAVGGGPFCLPMSDGNALAGFRFGDDAPWLLLETHYDNPSGLGNIVDRSGVKITMIPKSSGIQEASYLWVGLNPEASGVPAKKTSYGGRVHLSPNSRRRDNHFCIRPPFSPAGQKNVY